MGSKELTFIEDLHNAKTYVGTLNSYNPQQQSSGVNVPVLQLSSEMNSGRFNTLLHVAQLVNRDGI